MIQDGGEQETAQGRISLFPCFLFLYRFRSRRPNDEFSLSRLLLDLNEKSVHSRSFVVKFRSKLHYRSDGSYVLNSILPY